MKRIRRAEDQTKIARAKARKKNKIKLARPPALGVLDHNLDPLSFNPLPYPLSWGASGTQISPGYFPVFSIFCTKLFRFVE